MSHSIIQGKNGRSQEVDFENVNIAVRVHLGDECAEIAVEANEPLTYPDKQKLAILNIDRNDFEAAGLPKI